jgi:hypothetical protein
MGSPRAAKTGDFSFVFLRFEATQLRDIGVEVAQGVEAVHIRELLQAALFPHIDASGQAIAAAVERYNQRFLKTAGVVGSRGVAIVVIVEGDGGLNAICIAHHRRYELPAFAGAQPLQLVVGSPGKWETAKHWRKRTADLVKLPGLQLVVVEPTLPGNRLRLKDADVLCDCHLINVRWGHMLPRP